MRKVLLLLSVFTFLGASSLFAQDRVITGKVTSAEDGSPLPGVNVVIKGTTNGTVTDIDGNYKLSVPESGGTLVFSFIGLESQDIEIGNRSSIDAVMSSDIQQLSEVVVTALGVTREKASLGYATQDVEAEEVTKAKEQNFVNSLSGRVSGVQIKQNNNFGGSTNVVIRGNASITGSNQALFVVDGIPIDNRTGNDAYQTAGRYGYDYGNAASDINPEDIESINVLKGAAATALYGSRASNGAIVITTKKGESRKGLGISVSTGFTVGKIDKSTFVEYQDQYGAGYSNYYYGNDGGPFDDFYDVNGDGTPDLIVPTYEDASYGEKFDPNLNVYHWDSFVPESPNYGKAYPWLAAKNTPVSFFETAYTVNNSVSLTGGNDKNTFRLSYTNYSGSGVLPNSQVHKNTFGFNGSSQINDKLTASVGVNYVNNDVIGRNSTGYGDNIMANFRQWWETNVDVESLKDLYFQTRRNVTWNMYDAGGGDYDPIFWDNPYWTRFENYESDTRNRVFGNFVLKYDINDWLSLTGRATLDRYNEVREQRRAIGSVASEFGINKLDEQSGYQREDRAVSEINYDLFMTANKNLSPDLNLYAMLGFNIRQNSFESVLASTNGGLAIPRLYTLSNSLQENPFPVETLREKEVAGVYANVNLGYKDMLYLELTGRRDQSSALPVGNNVYFYPAASLSFVFSEVANASWLNFGKARINYAEVGGDTDAGNVYDYYLREPNFSGGVLTRARIYKNNPDLKPERSKSFEFGLEASMFNDRLSFDFAAYNTNTFDQIMTIEVSRATGYRYKTLNGGEVNNKGLEITLGGDIIRSQSGFNWKASLNWSKNVSKVIELVPGVENFVLGSYQGGVSLNATVGEPFGVIRGTGFQIDPASGKRVVNSSGYYIAVPDQIIGNPNPDWLGGLTNTLSYKGVSLSFLIDMSKGGDVYSLDMHYGQGTGIPVSTVGTNDLGNDWRLPVSQGGGIKLDGVKEDGTPNDIYARADYYGGVFYWGNSSRNPGELTVYDATYVKLREASLTYSLPKSLLGNAIQNVNLSIVGRNLWIMHKNVPYADPESGLGAGNAQGYLSGSYPTTRTVGFRVDIDF
ncbi:MAG: SusC/RagA family TonB-linked outer membrane protein [Cyclobacteriaceae bacterium]|nr:SusC/RagA family TonB-linked outer membrane protein [Cyclobacteriaceae bacterium]